MSDLTRADRTGRMSGWFDRLGDLANAILVKETRQALKSRQFVATFLLLLAAAWVVSLWKLLESPGAVEFGAIGRDFFFLFYLVLAVATLLIIPYSAYRSMLSEREQNTFELLSITTLKPRQIVWGKLLGAVVQLFLFYSAVAPFIAFSSLLQGFDSFTAFYVLVMSQLASILLSMAALTCSTLARQRAAQGAMSLVLIAGLGLALFGMGRFVFSLIRDSSRVFGDTEFWWINAFALIAAASYFVLFQEITSAQLTFESNNRSTRIRIVVAGQFWLLWGSYAGFLVVRGLSPFSEPTLALALFSGMHWFVVGMFAVTEDDRLSRRVQRGIPRHRWLRVPAVPLMPGGSRGYVFVVLHLCALWWILAIVQSFDRSAVPLGGGPSYFAGLFDLDSKSWTNEVRLTTGLICYAVVYLGIASALGRVLRRISSEILASHVRVFAFLIFVTGYILPRVLEAVDAISDIGYSYFEIFDPRETVVMLFQGNNEWKTVTIVLLSAAAAVIAANGPAVFKGALEIFRGPAESDSRIT